LQEGDIIIEIPLLIVMIVLLVFLMRSIKIFKPYERGVVTRSGKFVGTTESRILYIIPLIHKVTRVDMREQELRIPSQKITTKDNSEIVVEPEIHYKISSPAVAFDHLDNMETALEDLVMTHVRKVVESLNSRDVESAEISDKLQQILSKPAEEWGIELTKVTLSFS
jgi:regulator of protease activity HflC (stomatin/prohibitin superfamily)